MGITTTIHLQSCEFSKNESTVIEYGALEASVFRFQSGVCGLRVTNQQGNFVVLPYQGQQIWSVEFAGRSLGMKSMFEEPQPSKEYLSNYGAFLLHCGMLSMGNPGSEDTHPLHGELPNAPFQKAYLRSGHDEAGAYLEVGGSYRHTIAFTCDYTAEPTVRLYENATTLQISLKFSNLKSTSLEYMYMAHVNFQPVDYGRLVYSGLCDKDSVEVRRSIPAHVKPDPKYLDFIEKVADNPQILNVIDPDYPLYQEVVQFLQYKAANDGWAHSMQVRPDGSADYIKHRPEQLDKIVRWIVRTGDEDAMGLALPSTAGPEGYTKEKQKGNIRTIEPKSSVEFHLEAGLLNAKQAEEMESFIETIMKEE